MRPADRGLRSRSAVPGSRGWGLAGVAGARSRRDASPSVLVGQAWVLPAIVAIVAVGFALRLAAAARLTPHVDEAASLLAAHMVAERGLPILPSGTVYLQGATLSYLLAPFVWLGVGDLADLEALRAVSVVAGTASVYLAYRLGRGATGDGRVGALAAALVALDPVSVQWSGAVRMYGPLQAFSLAFVWAFLVALAGSPSRRLLAGLVALAWLAVFTHIGAALLLPPMVLVALALHRRALIRERWPFAVALGLCVLAPIALMGLNRALGSASVGGTDSSPIPFIDFVGDQLLGVNSAIRERLEFVAQEPHVPKGGTLMWLVPMATVGASTLIAGWHFLYGGGAFERRAPNAAARRRAVAALILLYWMPIVAVAIATIKFKARYTLHVNALGAVLVAAVVAEVLRRQRGRLRRRGWRVWLGRTIALGFLLLVLVPLGRGVAWRLENPVVHSDHVAALLYVAELHRTGEPVVVAMPAIGYLALGGADDLRFLAGPEDRHRSQRYTRRDAQGRLGDYWIGVDSFTSFRQVCGFLDANPTAWIVVDTERLAADGAYSGPMADAIRASTRVVHTEAGGALVLRPTPNSASGVAADPCAP